MVGISDLGSFSLKSPIWDWKVWIWRIPNCEVGHLFQLLGNFSNFKLSNFPRLNSNSWDHKNPGLIKTTSETFNPALKSSREEMFDGNWTGSVSKSRFHSKNDYFKNFDRSIFHHDHCKSDYLIEHLIIWNWLSKIVFLDELKPCSRKLKIFKKIKLLLSVWIRSDRFCSVQNGSDRV